MEATSNAPAEPELRQQTEQDRQHAERRKALVQHMHRHAEQFEQVNDALSDGDLEALWSPAYWLSRHEAVNGFQPEWQPHLVKMRNAASSLEDAPDLEAARHASNRIAQACNGCHTAAKVKKVIYPVDPL